MADETVDIEILGRDRASGIFSDVRSSLSRMLEVAGGILTFRTFERIGEAIMDSVRAAAEAYTWYDRIRFSLYQLSLADILASGETESVGRAMRMASAEAKNLLDWVKQTALSAPFTMEQVNQLFRLARAYGFSADEAQRLTEVSIDFASATGFGQEVLQRLGLALGQVRQRGRLAGEEIRQLINVGIPVRDIIAKAFGKTTAEIEKMIRKGLIPGGEALQAILGWMERFEGSGEAALKTWWGLSAQMKTVKDLNLISLFDGIGKALVPAMQSLKDMFTSDAWLHFVGTVGEAIGGFISNTLPNLENLVMAWKDLTIALQDLSTMDPKDVIAILASVLDLDMGTILDIYTRITGAFQGLDDAWANLSASAQPIKDALPGIVASLGELTIKGIETWGPVFVDFVDSLAAMVETAAPFYLETLSGSLSNLGIAWETHGEGIAEFGGLLLRITGATVVGGLALLGAVLGTIVDIITNAPLKETNERWGAFFGLIKDLSLQAAQVPEADFNKTWQGIADLWNTLMAGPPAPTAEQGALASPVDEIFLQWQRDVTISGGEWRQEMSGFMSETLAEMTTNEPQRWAPLGTSVVRSMGDGMVSEARFVRDRLKKELDEIRKMVQELYRIESPSLVFEDIGKNVMRGLAQGLQKGAEGAKYAMTQATGGAMGAGASVIGQRNISIGMGDVYLSTELELHQFEAVLRRMSGVQ